MNRLQNFIASLSKTAVMTIACLFVGLCFGLSQLISAPDAARVRLESLLRGAGFDQARVETLHIGLTKMRATNIKLDSDGFDTIKEIDADIGWYGLLTGKGIHELRIDGMTLTRTGTSLSGSLRQLVQNILNVPDFRIVLTNGTVDMATDYGDIRITMETTINTDLVRRVRDVKARVKADQYQLGFDSLWEGTLNEAGQLELSATLNDGRLNFGPVKISRFNGWLGVSVNNKGYSIQNQIEAGRATFLDLPLQSLQLAGDFNPQKSNLLFRAGISGKPDMGFTAEFSKPSAKPAGFEALLEGGDLGGLLSYANDLAKVDKPIRPALQNAGKFLLTLKFEPDKRFAGGPLPFYLLLETSGKKALEGNVLYYSDSHDLRGSAEASPDMAGALRDYFKIPDGHVRGNFIRLDSSAKKILHIEDKYTAPAPPRP